jgi:hypothetical protein
LSALASEQTVVLHIALRIARTVPYITTALLPSRKSTTAAGAATIDGEGIGAIQRRLNQETPEW